MKLLKEISVSLIYCLCSIYCLNAQCDCKNQPLDLLQLDLYPSFQDFSSIRITCDSNIAILSIHRFEPKGKLINQEQFFIPRKLYKSLINQLKPLEVLSMQDEMNPNLLDGMLADITFIDKQEKFNRFKIQIPKRKNRHIILIETIISTTERLPISDEYKNHLKEVKNWYLKYCK